MSEWMYRTTFFNEQSELATIEKYENIRNWSTKLHVLDYKLPDLFGLGKLE
jgi:hypothetical protein